MESGRVFRLVEGSLMALFFIQAARLVLSDAALLGGAWGGQGRLIEGVGYGLLVLLLVFIFPLPVPGRRKAVPAVLLISAVLSAVARSAVSYLAGHFQTAAALVLLMFATVYLLTLLRANRLAWLTGMVVGLSLEQSLRAFDTIDFTLQPSIDISIAGALYRVPWVVIQIGVSMVVVLCSVIARRQAVNEPFVPGQFSLQGGLALGGFLALEVGVLGQPALIARWADLPVPALTMWIVLVTMLPLLPAVRHVVSDMLHVLDERFRGLVWFAGFLLMVLAGNRLPGLASGVTLIIAQLMAVLLLWWTADSKDANAGGFSTGAGYAVSTPVFIGLLLAYEATLTPLPGTEWLAGRGVFVLIVAAALLGAPRLIWREVDPWRWPSPIPSPLMAGGVVLLTALTLILSTVDVQDRSTGSSNTLRVATYNINGGIDEAGRYRLDLIERTMRASLADVIVLQEVDSGRLTSFNHDQAHALARRLGYYEAYAPAADRGRGVAVVSRWPLFQPQTGVLPGGAMDGSGVMRVVVQDPVTLRTVVIAVVQFPDGTDEILLEQLAVTRSLIGEETPLVLAGDFGGDTSSLSYREFMTVGFVDPDSVLGVERGYTTPASAPSTRHDFVLLRGLIPLDTRQVDSTASDHRLVVVEAGWP
ncbi:MAG: endonuclease/exonuclease/phosphatase family protein [Anaerolineae bacterium]|nr:endonuclease/exonuclease/phosphatase family protein [Anaerolineae bacterium]